jgi:hypothetical protein
MSGGFGWNRNDRSHQSPTRVDNDRGGFTDAFKGYKGAPRVSHVGKSPQPASAPAQSAQTPPPRQSFRQSTVKQSIPNARHALSTTAANVLIVVMDVTASNAQNVPEIFKRLPLMYEEACTYLGSRDLEMLFIAHGDARTDRHATQVAHLGRGPELDEILTSFYRNCGGGGQGSETSELVAYYLLKQLDTSSAQNVYAWFLTDEAGCREIDARLVRDELDLELDREFKDARSVFMALQRKMHVFTILLESDSYSRYPTLKAKIRPYWEWALGGRESVIPLDDTRRIVDVMLGTVAKMTGQIDAFTQALQGRQMPTHHGAQNVATVMKSIVLVGRGTPSAPHVLPAATRPLLPAPKTGTRSLLGRTSGS